MNSTTSYREFARELITTGELDPLYTLAYRARAVKGDEWVTKFCLYMLMFYESNGAVQAAESRDFWQYVRDNYSTAPRGTERRYFRGEAGIASYTSLQALGSPTAAFQTPVQADTLPAFRKALYEAKVSGFGDYFMLKWVDYATCVFDAPIDVSHLPFMLPSPPLKCIKQVFPDKYVKDGLEEIASWVSDMDDPFSGKRKCGLMETETIACAIPSYLIKKKYKMGDDINKYRRQLKDYPELIALLP